MDTVHLLLQDADSGKVLRAALEAQVRQYQHAAEYHRQSATLRTRANDRREAARHTRQAATYTTRATLAQQLVDQLPDA